MNMLYHADIKYSAKYFFFQQLDIISPLQIYLDPTAVFSKYQVKVKLKKFTIIDIDMLLTIQTINYMTI